VPWSGERHRVYIAVLDALRERTGCALCRLEAAGAHRYLDGVLYERATDSEYRSHLVRAGGFCPRHAHQLADLPDCLGVAMLYDGLLRGYLDSLTRLARGGPDRFRWLKNIAARWTGLRPAPPCPACVIQSDQRDRYAAMIADGWSDMALHDAMEGASPLCAAHFHGVARKMNTRDDRVALAFIEAGKIAALLDQLEEFLDHQRMERLNESWGPERDAWIRAVEVMTGVRGIA